MIDTGVLATEAPAAKISRLGQLGTLTMAMLRGFFRDRITIFFTFLFPLMFLVVFGLIFGSSATESVRIGVVGDGPVLAAAARGHRRHRPRYDTLEEAQEAVRRGDIPAVVSQDGVRRHA